MTKKNNDIFKQIMDSRIAWDVFQGKIYNRVIWNTAGSIVRNIIDSIELPCPNPVALDIGSGPGFATIYAAEKFPSAVITGLDYSGEQIKYANRQLKKSHVSNCSFKLGDAMELPFDDNTFDLIFSIASIKHWPDGVRGLREVRRVLKPGCTAYIGEADREHNPADLDNFINSFTSPWWVNKYIVGWYLRHTVFGQSYTRREAEEMAEKAGFTKIETSTVTGTPAFKMVLYKPHI